METSATRLAFASVALATEHLKQPIVAAAPDKSPLGVEIALTTPDVPPLFQRAVKAGATAVSEPATKPWGQIVAYVCDKAGFLAELYTPLSCPIAEKPLAKADRSSFALPCRDSVSLLCLNFHPSLSYASCPPRSSPP